MWQCDNCGYTDDDGKTFEQEVVGDNPDDPVRYCPECGSDEVFLVDEEDDASLYDDDDKDKKRDWDGEEDEDADADDED